MVAKQYGLGTKNVPTPQDLGLVGKGGQSDALRDFIQGAAERECGAACCLRCRKSCSCTKSSEGERTLGREGGSEKEDCRVDVVSGRGINSAGKERCGGESHGERQDCQRQADRVDPAVVSFRDLEGEVINEMKFAADLNVKLNATDKHAEDVTYARDGLLAYF